MGMNVGTSSSENEPMMDINTTPLIDVMLVLIIMLIITIPIQLHSVNMEMPVGAPPTQEKPNEVRVDINAQGVIFWDGVVIDRVALDSKMADLGNLPNPPVLLIRPDRASRYEVAAFVLANAQRRKITKMAIIGGEQFR